MNRKAKHRPPEILTSKERNQLAKLTKKAFQERDWIEGLGKAAEGLSWLAGPVAAKGAARAVKTFIKPPKTKTYGEVFDRTPAKIRSITPKPPAKLPPNVTRIPKDQFKIDVEDAVQQIAKNTPGLSKEDLFLYKQLFLAGVKLPVKVKPKKTPIPGSEAFSRMLSSAPKSNVVKLPNQQITKQGADLSTKGIDKSNLLDFPFERIKPPKPRKARGGKIKKGYARGGGIRKPKGF